jgi:cell cycle sensor histidine kinase DivJ
VINSESVCGLAACFGSLVHHSARGDRQTAARHRVFIASHLLVGLLALSAFPIYLVVSGKPSLLAASVFLWLLTPILVAAYLSRAGRFAAACLVSMANFAGLAAYSAWLTGGLSPWSLPWTIVFLGVLSAALYDLAATIQAARKRSDNTRHTSEERYRLLAENATDMITRHDERGRVLFASLAAQQLFGEPSQNILGDGLFERVHVADRPAYLTALSRCHADAEAIAVEFRVRRAGDAGRYVWVEMRCRPMPPVEGGAQERQGIVAITRDISERKAQEAELLRIRDEAENASRAKTQFLANMSHELRTPLNAVIGFSEILNRELFGALGEDRYREYARLIHESGEHLLHVVNDILDMSKIEAGRFNIVREPFDVAALVRSCCDVMRHAAGQKSISLFVDIEPDMPELLADKRACKQILLNVISNAVKFTDPGGWVRVSARAVDGHAEFIVADNGIGIAGEDLPKLGNPFVQAHRPYDRNYDGAGLGLSVVKGLARLHGGKLELESELGRGTAATIVLPLEAPGEAADSPQPARAMSAA